MALSPIGSERPFRQIIGAFPRAPHPPSHHERSSRGHKRPGPGSLVSIGAFPFPPLLESTGADASRLHLYGPDRLSDALRDAAMEKFGSAAALRACAVHLRYDPCMALDFPPTNAAASGPAVLHD